MSIKSKGKLLIFIGAAAALAASLINDKNNKNKTVEEIKENK